MASAHHPAQAPRYSLPPMPNATNDFRLPSLKDLNFQYRSPGQGQDIPPAPMTNGSPQAEHVGSSQSHSGRHDPTSWARPSPTTPVSASMPPQHQHQAQHHQTHPHANQHTNQQHSHSNSHQLSPPTPSGGHDHGIARPIEYSAPRPENGLHSHQLAPPTPSSGHEHNLARSIDYGAQRHQNGGYLPPGLPLSAQVTPIPGSVTIGPGSRGDDSHHPSKRSRTNSNMSVPRDSRSSHVSHIPPLHGAKG